MSSPYTLPAGPTRVADRSTSMPPPDPRSSTVWPGSSARRAVGLPQPSDAATAVSGSAPRSASEYRFDVIGSPQHGRPQQPADVEEAPSVTASASAPYLSRTAF